MRKKQNLRPPEELSMKNESGFKSVPLLKLGGLKRCSRRVKKLKASMTFLLMILLSSCASVGVQRSQTPDYITNWIVPEMQIEESQLPEFPDCGNDVVGDIYNCEQAAVDWGCTIASQFRAFAKRATKDPLTKQSQSVSNPKICSQRAEQ